jgi:hypothetical protein
MKIEQLIELIKTSSLSRVKRRFCGKVLGYGTYRDVYELKGNPDYVIKIEAHPNFRVFANVTEYRNWADNMRWSWLSQYLAPCLYISECGRVLIQRRVTFKEKKFYPKGIPALFTDTKIQNFGWIGNRFVCCDYSFFVICVGKGDRPMKRVKWGDTGIRQ